MKSKIVLGVVAAVVLLEAENIMARGRQARPEASQEQRRMRRPRVQPRQEGPAQQFSGRSRRQEFTPGPMQWGRLGAARPRPDIGQRRFAAAVGRPGQFRGDRAGRGRGGGRRGWGMAGRCMMAPYGGMMYRWGARMPNMGRWSGCLGPRCMMMQRRAMWDRLGKALRRRNWARPGPGLMPAPPMPEKPGPDRPPEGIERRGRGEPPADMERPGRRGPTPGVERRGRRGPPEDVDAPPGIGRRRGRAVTRPGAGEPRPSPPLTD